MAVIEFIEMCKEIEEIHSMDYSYECLGLTTPITPNLINREKPLPTTIEILTSSPQLPASSISTGILDSDMQELDIEKQELEQLSEEVDMLHSYLQDKIQCYEQLKYKVVELSHKLDGVVSNGNLVQNLVPSKEKLYKICEEVIQVTPTILGEAEITGYGTSSTCSSLLQQDLTQATLPLDIQFDTTQGISYYDKNDQKPCDCTALTSNGPCMASSSCSATPLSPISKSLGTSKDKIYITGMPYSPISQVKKVLGAAPISIQLRHIRNISWIDGYILEILVDPNHVDRMKNRISKYSEYYVTTTFDPLSPNSFNWEGKVLPESKELILKINFVERLAASVASSSQSTT
ncbi:hypothetical protein L873DRAFT_1789164 [Choiromyces venosus 120613-1]|uniref:Uncharacterized protein n=1 Tax=Choiromyces venosus 120613-1 TaxID=1336337 RepID=A0A3N4JT93_9PEZI|nr:hypothetical protein L873DRAFT_1789164 [Choiromyces venosus 120613-1]